MIYSFEGVDGCGKTTLIDEVYEILSKWDMPVVRLIEPSGVYRKLLKSGEVNNFAERFYIMMACRAKMQSEYMKNKNNIVLLDRYIHSTLAYQPLQFNVTQEEILKMNRDFEKPEMTFWLNTPLGTCKQRLNKRGRDEDDKFSDEFYSDVNKAYEKMYKKQTLNPIVKAYAFGSALPDCFSIAWAIRKDYEKKAKRKENEMMKNFMQLAENLLNYAPSELDVIRRVTVTDDSCMLLINPLEINEEFVVNVLSMHPTFKYEVKALPEGEMFIVTMKGETDD